MSEYAITLGPEAERHSAPISPEFGTMHMVSGAVDETVGLDACAVRALVLVEEEVSAGSTVQAQPIALVHLAVGGESVDEVVCVEEGSSPAEIVRLADAPAGREMLRDAILRAHPGKPWSLVALEDLLHAEQMLGSAWLNYLRAGIGAR
jgi:inorganic pyrophosphatase